MRMLEGRLNIPELEYLYERGILTRAGLERGFIVNAYIDLRNGETLIKDVYIILSRKYNKSEHTIKNIILQYFRLED